MGFPHEKPQAFDRELSLMRPAFESIDQIVGLGPTPNLLLFLP